jgi:hypothetical protein
MERQEEEIDEIRQGYVEMGEMMELIMEQLKAR